MKLPTVGTLAVLLLAPSPGCARDAVRAERIGPPSRMEYGGDRGKFSLRYEGVTAHIAFGAHSVTLDTGDGAAITVHASDDGVTAWRADAPEEKVRLPDPELAPGAVLRWDGKTWVRVPD